MLRVPYSVYPNGLFQVVDPFGFLVTCPLMVGGRGNSGSMFLYGVGVNEQTDGYLSARLINYLIIHFGIIINCSFIRTYTASE